MTSSNNGIQKINYQMREQDNECTVILLGESGVGKSTFINAWSNNLIYNSCEEALKKPKIFFFKACLIDNTLFSTVSVRETRGASHYTINIDNKLKYKSEYNQSTHRKPKHKEIKNDRREKHRHRHR